MGRVESPPLRSEILLTQGTDLNEPGKRLFIGATKRVKKVLVSGGIATAAIRQANEGDKITDIVNGVGDFLGPRELFRRIHTTRQWRRFIAVTFAPL